MRTPDMLCSALALLLFAGAAPEPGSGRGGGLGVEAQEGAALDGGEI
jgi:hypothetical protein